LAKIDVRGWPRSDAWQARRVAVDLERATAEYRSAHQAVDDAKAQLAAGHARVRAARETLAQAVVAAYLDGTRMRDLAEITGLSRERLRQVLRAAGVDPD
jgi:hypothetical protein